MQEMYLTYILIGFTVLLSINALNNSTLKAKLIFNAAKTYHGKEWYRLFSSGLIHADILHLVMNMYVLYIFGQPAELLYEYYAIPGGKWMFVLMYVLSLGASSVYSMFKFKDIPQYNALGASGGTSAVIMSFVLLSPMAEYMAGIPMVVVGVGFIAYSHYASKNAKDNIGHDAHFWGGVFGFIFPLVLKPSLFIDVFLKEISSWLG